MTNPYYSGPVSDHFDGARFFITPGSGNARRRDLLKLQIEMARSEGWPAQWPSPYQDVPPQRFEGAGVRVSYIGHASFLIQCAGVNLLVDPVWSQRASPSSFIGPKRICAPGVRLEDLPPLDAILLSHNHYDHLDGATLKRLARALPCPVLTPLGNDAILRKIDRKIEARVHDWGESAQVGALKIHFEPAYHWSARGLRDRRMALWCAFVIETPHGKLYHVADTAFGDGRIFHALREKHGAMDFAHLPIGAYAPRWFMQASHVDPEEAVRIFQIVGARQALAHHWGCFRLTTEPVSEPPQLLRKALAQAGLAEDRFLVRRPGEFVEFR